MDKSAPCTCICTSVPPSDGPLDGERLDGRGQVVRNVATHARIGESVAETATVHRTAAEVASAERDQRPTENRASAGANLVHTRVNEISEVEPPGELLRIEPNADAHEHRGDAAKRRRHTEECVASLVNPTRVHRDIAQRDAAVRATAQRAAGQQEVSGA
eukprot:scaffold26940_cov117-Phaeocystis_antarctica.AAC.10